MTIRWGSQASTWAFSRRVYRRTVLVGAVMLLVLVAAGFLTLLLPGAGIGSSKAVGVLLGQETGFARTVVMEWRLPRLVAAAVIGAALALAGALFQALTRNPLGSPDIIGFNTGAYTGVLFTLLMGASSFAAISFGALIGGCLTAVAVFLLSAQRGHTISGIRLILVGLGISMMLSSFNRWLILRGDMETALSAASWGAGTLNGVRWEQAIPAAVCLGALVAIALVAFRGINILALGDDTATGLGLGVNRIKALMLSIGVLLTAISTAVAGPISFVALASPHIAARLTRSPRIPLAVTALTGASLLVVSDILAQRLFAPVQLPVGLITVTLGGIYLLTLIARPAKN
ncbi:iron chelate uptake ABC transporter family permease subunit [Corynebacterium testudinoris]|uniref:ABC-type enterobactin transport system, permease component n=2 Tax=Corynebacterium testudinoris TaxID=136857 RepID=A0A0G3H706_9CORY|nr:ABC-type enterobactin transport system, permease component [Corynebacterium testudinoris]MBX8996522.1 iron chelate uptake ABC transporter family permease subunit [Corynebacterium testudinoris]